MSEGKQTVGSTENGSGTEENDSDQNLREKATEKLLAELRNVFNQNFPGYLEDTSLGINHGEGKELWEIKFSVNEDGGSKENETLVKVKSHCGENGASNDIIFKLEQTKDREGIRINLRKDGKRGTKSFEVLRLGDLRSDGIWKAGGNEISLRYTGKTFSQNVLEVWFSESESNEGSILKRPVSLKINDNDKKGSKLRLSKYWAEFSEEGLNVGVPRVKVKHKKEDKKFRTEINDNIGWMRLGLSCLVYWILCNVYDGDGELREDNRIPSGFPDLVKYRAKRPVDLDPAEVVKNLEDEDRDQKLYFPWHVIESACSALNAGKNVIFTGPPGCGKSKLASFLSEKATGQEPLMTTASPAWSTGDLIGRYMPDREGQGLVFEEGVFLRALGDTDEPSRWLVIDEFNRADIDACFGELFSVLAGDSVELPFKTERKSEDDAEEEEYDTSHPVRITPEGDKAETEADYLVPGKFRLIGTMNDADRSGLNNLSFALMRRFAIIQVESPDSDDTKTIVEDHINRTAEELDLGSNAWNVSGGSTTRCKIGASDEGRSIEKELEFLFASGREERKNDFQNLVSDGVVGVSIIGDVIRFVGEGIRGDGQRLKKTDDLWKKVGGRNRRSMEKWAENLTLSYLALATVLQIFP